MSAYQLAQLNLATMRFPLEAPDMADFVANLDRVNALAESAPGFVWRLVTDEGNATALRPFGETTLVNMSVWESAAALRDFVFNSPHVAIMRRRREWFERMAEPYLVLWWVPKGHVPTVEEAKARLMRLRAHGPTREAFTFRQAFPPPDAEGTAGPIPLGGTCPAT